MNKLLSIIIGTILIGHTTALEAITWKCIQSSQKDSNRHVFVGNVSGTLMCAGIEDRCLWFDSCPESVPDYAYGVLPCPQETDNDWCIIGGLNLGMAYECGCKIGGNTLPPPAPPAPAEPFATEPPPAPTTDSEPPAPTTDSAQPTPEPPPPPTTDSAQPTTEPAPPTTDSAPPATKTTKVATATNNPNDLPWKKAFLTGYSSYPPPGSKECIEYSGCKWAGQFAYVPGKWSEEKVKETNIVSVYVIGFGDAGPYKNKIMAIMDPDTSNTIIANVLDTCADSDTPNNDCSRNAKKSPDGVLIDMEKYTAERFLGKTINPDFSNFQNKMVLFKCINC